MGEIDPGSAREEAERLVATALAAVRLAGSDGGAGLLGAFGPVGEMISGALGHAGGGSDQGHAGGSDQSRAGRFATGSAECCVCPICRTMTALRDPSPEFAERLATGAGDFAAGVASLLRALSTGGAAPGTGPAEAAEPTVVDPPAAPGGSDDDLVWRTATRTRHDSPPTGQPDVWAAATRADDPAVADRAGGPAATSRPNPAGAQDGGSTTQQDGGRATVPASRTPGEHLADADGASADEG